MQGSTGAQIACLPHMMSSAYIAMKRTPGRGGEERNWDEEMCQITGTNREAERRKPLLPLGVIIWVEQTVILLCSQDQGWKGRW